MIITETKIAVRPDTTVPFFNNTTISNEVSVRELYTPFIADGRLSVSREISSDGLQQTTINTYSSMEVYSQIDTILSIDLDYAYCMYADENNFQLNVGQQYIQTGIDAPFTCTTTYSYGANVYELYPLFDSFINVIESSMALESFINTGTQLIAVHQYSNSADFTHNHWADYSLIKSLYNAKLTRTIKYELV